MPKISNIQEKTIETGEMFRSLEVRENGVNAENRTVELSFSSDTPYKRWFGFEILDHAPSSVRLGRLKNAGPLLDTHYGDQIGVIESVSLDGSKGTAVVRFSKNQRADEVFKDVQDGIRRNVSVGYAVHRMLLESEDDEKGDTYRVVDWEPFEISMVPVPADATVGVGREAKYQTRVVSEIKTKTGVTKMADENKTEKNEPIVQVREVEKIRPMNEQEKTEALRGMRDEENKRRTEISAMAKEFPQCRELCEAAIAEGKPVEDVRADMLKALSTGKNAVIREAPNSPNIGMSDKEIRQYSFTKAAMALCGMEVDAGLEREASKAYEQLTRKSPKGIWVPHDVLSAPQRRDLTVAGTVSNVVATNLLSGSFIDLLRNSMALTELGVAEMNGLVGDIAIPKQTGGSTAYWVAEGIAPTESQQTLGQITATPKTCGAYTDISRKSLQQSSIQLEQFVRTDLATNLAIAMDSAGINGTGADAQPTGLLLASGVSAQAITLAGTSPTWSEVAQHEEAIDIDNARVGAMGWLMTPTVKRILKTTEKASNTGIYLLMNGQLDEYRAVMSNQCPSGYLILGVWSQLVRAMWGGLDLLVNPYGTDGGASGTIRIRVLQDVDFMVRHGQSFAYSAGITGE